MTHVVWVLSSVAIAGSALSLMLMLVLRLIWSPQEGSPEQQAEEIDSWKRVIKGISACLAFSIFAWLLAPHLSDHIFGRVDLALLLAFLALGKLLGRLTSKPGNKLPG